jgi:hypothetical protein
MSDDTVRGFSNGTDYMGWNERNCCRCKKYHVVAGEVVEPLCDIENAVASTIIPRSIAERAGCSDSGYLLPDCKEREDE